MKPFWLKCLPQFIRVQVEERHHLQSVLDNTGWLFLDKILRMGVGLFITAWIARYLGTDQFGQLSYAMAFVVLFSSLASLGLDVIVVRNIVRDPLSKDTILGTTFFLKLAGGFVAFILSIGAIFILRPVDNSTHWMVAVIAGGMIFQAFDTIDLWFQSQIQSKYSVISKNSAFLLISIVKIIMIEANAPLIAFAWAGISEIAFGSIGLMVAYRINGLSLKSWHTSVQLTKELLRDSWPLIFSGIVIMIYTRIDQIMIGQMLGDHEVGVYSAAVRISEIWYFIPISVGSSMFPGIIDSKNRNEIERYKSLLKKLFKYSIWASLCIAAIVTFTSPTLIALLFGPEYHDAALVLSIHVWAGVFAVFGTAKGKFMYAENIQGLSAVYSTVGAIINIYLNFVLIPTQGIYGAAIATLISQIVSSVILPCFHRIDRISIKLLFESLFFFVPDRG